MRARKLPLLLLATAVGAVLASTASSVQAAAVAPRLEAPMQPLAVGTWGHSAFPGMAKLHDGSLRLVFREGSDHEAHHDGRIIIAESHDLGATWGNPQVLRAGGDWRDPFISSVDGAEFLTWFGANAANPALGAGVVRMWGYDRRIDPATNPIGAISAPVVKLPDGRLGAPFYGRKPGEALDTAWMGWSSDGGWSWSSNRIVNFLGGNTATPEPYLVVNGSTVHMLYRWGVADGIGIRSSPDSGVTWSPPQKILSNASGRPTTIATSSGVLVVVYRELPSKSAVMAYSTDNGVSWVKAGVVLAAPPGSPLGMTYATMVETSPGRIRLIVGMEQADGSSDLWGGEVVVP